MATLPARCLAIGLLLFATLTGCGGRGEPTPSADGSTTRASAGADVTVNEGASVTLTGSGSDSAGSVTGYSWSQVSGPPVLLNPSDAPGVTIVTPQVTANQIIVLQLTVTGTGGTDTDEVQITVVNVPRTSGTISGKVINGLTGSSISGANVMVAGTGASTDANGDFSVTASVSDRIPVTVTHTGYSAQQKITSLTSDRFEDYLTIRILPVSSTTSFDPAVGATLAVGGTTASVVIPANALVTAGGGAPVGSVTAYLTVIDPRNDAEMLTGDYLGSTGAGSLQNMESFGALSIVIVDSTGAALQLVGGATATIQIPATPRGSASAPATAPLFDYDATAHNWVQQGSATLVDATPDYYSATVDSLGTWGAASAYTGVNISGCIEDEFGIPVFSARVSAGGDDYNGTAIAYSNVDGTFTVAAKASSRVLVSASNANSVSNTVAVTTGTGNTSISQCLLLSRAAANFKLSWGAAPSDLDSHLITPSNAHVYYASRGALTTAPYAALDVDDVTGYGPEVVTVTQLAPGQYKYYVHNFSGTYSPGQTGSPARVEVRVSGRTYTFAPPALGEAANAWWHVCNMDVSAGGAVTITPVGTWLATSPASITAPIVQKGYRQDKDLVSGP